MGLGWWGGWDRERMTDDRREYGGNHSIGGVVGGEWGAESGR